MLPEVWTEWGLPGGSLLGACRWCRLCQRREAGCRVTNALACSYCPLPAQCVADGVGEPLALLPVCPLQGSAQHTGLECPLQRTLGALIDIKCMQTF